MKNRALFVKRTGIVQATGALLGILSGAFIDPLGGHPSLSVLVGLAVIPLNIVLAFVQIVILVVLLRQSDSGHMTQMKLAGVYVAAGWLLTLAFIGWQWPPLFFSFGCLNQ